MTDCFVGDWTPAALCATLAAQKHCHAHAIPFPISHQNSLLSSTTRCPQHLPLRRDWVSPTHCPPRQALALTGRQAAGSWQTSLADSVRPRLARCQYSHRRCHSLGAPHAKRCPASDSFFLPAPHAQCRRAKRSRPLTTLGLTT